MDELGGHKLTAILIPSSPQGEQFCHACPTRGDGSCHTNPKRKPPLAVDDHLALRQADAGQAEAFLVEGGLVFPARFL